MGVESGGGRGCRGVHGLRRGRGGIVSISIISLFTAFFFGKERDCCFFSFHCMKRSIFLGHHLRGLDFFFVGLPF